MSEQADGEVRWVDVAVTNGESEPLFPVDSTKPVIDGPPGDVSTLRATANYTKCILGTGILAFPKAIQYSGLVGGLVGTVLLGVLCWYTMILIIRCASLARRVAPHRDNSQWITYAEIGFVAFGHAGYIFTWIGLIIMSIGSCSTYLVFMGTQMENLLSGYDSRLNKTTCILMLVPCYVLMSWLRSYKFLSPMSGIGLVCLVVAMIAVLVDSFKYHSFPRAIAEVGPAVDFGNFGEFLGIAAFLFMVHSVLPSAAQTMKTREKAPLVIGLSMIVSGVLALAFGCIIVALYGHLPVPGDILMCIRDGALKTTVQAAMTVNIFFTYTLFLFPFSNAVEENVLRKLISADRYEIGRNVLRAVFILATVGVALGMPHFVLMSMMTGAIGNNSLSFLLPPVFYLRLMYLAEWKHRTTGLSLKHCGDIVLCVITFSLGMFIFTYTPYVNLR